MKAKLLWLHILLFWPLQVKNKTIQRHKWDDLKKEATTTKKRLTKTKKLKVKKKSKKTSQMQDSGPRI